MKKEKKKIEKRKNFDRLCLNSIEGHTAIKSSETSHIDIQF